MIDLVAAARDEASALSHFSFELTPEQLLALVTLVIAGIDHPASHGETSVLSVGRSFVDGVLHCLKGFPAMRALVERGME